MNPSLGRWALPFFFLTGVTGLVYEVLWTRRLTLTFGHTVLAVSTVLTAYMAGLALGSLLGGRWTDRRWGRSLSAGFFFAAYGALELFVGLWALASLPLLELVEGAWLGLAGQGVTGLPLHLAGFLGAVAVLVPPTAAMGATLPVMTRVLVAEEGEVGTRLSRLYGLNTLGAFVGATLAGFVLFPWLGMRQALLAAAAVNLALGAAAWTLGRRPGPEAPPRGETAAATPPGGWPRRLVPLAFGAAGAASMVYQVGWTRGLILSLGSSTYAFSAILATFLAGLGLGSLLYPRLVRRPTLAHLAWLQVGVGLTGAATLPALGALPEVLHRLFPLVRDSFPRVLAMDAGIAGCLLLLPAFLMGLGFPLATQLYSQDLGLLGRDVGEVYSANTLGCIVGSFSAGFLLLPHLGVQDTLRLAVLANAAVALALFLAARGTGWRRAAGPAAALLTAAVALLLPPWDPARMTAGVAIYTREAREGPFRRGLLAPAFYRDGLSATVSVHILPNRHMALRVNGKTDASTGLPDMLTQRLLGLLPVFLHPDPRSVCVIGLGSGITLDAVRTTPGLERLDCVELEPAVAEASRLWTGWNGRVLEDPRVHLWLTDGRTFILGSPRRYDVIVSEPSNPWIAGIGNLFTRDFYQACARRLEPGGLMVQWVHLYGLSEADLGLIVRSFYDTFPHGSVWFSNPGDALLVGSLEPVAVDPERVRRLWGPRLYEIGLAAPGELAGHFLATREEALARLGAGGPFNTDDRPLLEFSAPMSMYDDTRGGANFDLLQGSRPLPPGVPDTPEARSAAAAPWAALGREDRVAARAGGDPPPLLRARLEAATGRPEAAREDFRRAIAAGDGPAAALAADFARQQGSSAEAVDLYRRALASPPPGSEAALWLGLGLALDGAGRPDEALAALDRAAAAGPGSRPLTEKGILLYRAGRLEEALEAFRAAAERDPADADARAGQGNALLRLERHREAREAYEEARRLRPDDPDTLVNLAACLVHLGDPAGAEAAYRAILSVHPDHEMARRNLDLLRGR